RAGAVAAAAPSRVKITCPSLIFSPSLTLTSFTTPVTEEGTSTTALSVSNSHTGWPSETLVPGEIIRRTRSPCEMFSPSSGSLNSLAPVRGAAGGAGFSAGGALSLLSAGAVAGAFGASGAGAGAAAVVAAALASAPSTVKIT